MAEQIRRLFAHANIVDLDTRRPAPVYRPAPQPPPPAGQPSWTPPPAAERWPEVDEDLDLEDDSAAEGGAMVRQESAKVPVEAPGPPASAPEEEEEEEKKKKKKKKKKRLREQALRFLQQHPRRPPAGPELVTWLEARQVVGLDLPPDWLPRPRRPPRWRPPSS